MRYKFTVVLYFLIGLNQYFLSQNKQDSVTYWKLKTLFGLNGTQSSFVNWNAGGKNNISLIGSISASAYFAKDQLNWSSDVNLALGGILYFDPNQNNPIQKTDDRIDLSSSYGVKFTKKFFISVVQGFKTQFVKGFSKPTDLNFVSRFMSPGYFNFALGTDYIKDDNFSIFASPMASKTTFVFDDSLSALGAFGVLPGEKNRLEYGAFFKMKYNKILMKNVEMKSKFELFSNYVSNPQNIDVNAELIFIFRVNSLFSSSAQCNLIYDDDVNILDNNGNTGPRTQFKSVLGIGISYKLENRRK
ncbi:MAG: DUF3078 domain-containing protein [Bacteroidetes bacterium]|nr:DUF3078 domain-containing protein [Bacteroidota bacterium]